MVPNVLVSYVPLFYGQPGTILEKDGEVEKTLKDAFDQEVGHSKGAAWSLEEDGSSAVTLILDKATEISKHLMAWSENKPSDWFTFQIVKNDGGYAIAIMPEMEKSMVRFKSTYKVADEEAKSVRIIFRPLTFSSESVSALNGAEPNIKDEIRVYVLDADLVNEKKFSPNHLNHRVELGKFKVVRDGFAKQYLEEMIASEKN
jgi:hypothetical protein